jgi:hypothetical protein
MNVHTSAPKFSATNLLYRAAKAKAIKSICIHHNSLALTIPFIRLSSTVTYSLIGAVICIHHQGWRASRSSCRRVQQPKFHSVSNEQPLQQQVVFIDLSFDLVRCFYLLSPKNSLFSDFKRTHPTRSFTSN